MKNDLISLYSTSNKPIIYQEFDYRSIVDISSCKNGKEIHEIIDQVRENLDTLIHAGHAKIYCPTEPYWVIICVYFKTQEDAAFAALNCSHLKEIMPNYLAS